MPEYPINQGYLHVFIDEEENHPNLINATVIYRATYPVIFDGNLQYTLCTWESYVENGEINFDFGRFLLNNKA